MSRTALMVALALSTSAFAAETTYRSDCRADPYGNSNCTLTIDRPPPPQEDFYRASGWEETILIPKASIPPRPVRSLPDNGCGPGFRMLPDLTCELKR